MVNVIKAIVIMAIVIMAIVIIVNVTLGVSTVETSRDRERPSCRD
jgi:hypothetical protein